MRRHHDDEIAGEPQKYYFEYIYGAHGVQKNLLPNPICGFKFIANGE